MELRLLTLDVEELEQLALVPEEAARRGIAVLGSRPTSTQARERPGTEAGARELVHLYAEAAAEMRMLRYAFTTKSRTYNKSRRRYDAVEKAMADVQVEIVPQLRGRLRELRRREATLEEKLKSKAIDAAAIGPQVPAGRAIDPTPKPGETTERSPRLLPLPQRRGRLSRLIDAVHGRR